MTKFLRDGKKCSYTKGEIKIMEQERSNIGTEVEGIYGRITNTKELKRSHQNHLCRNFLNYISA